jgi:putative transcriptional regulator
MTSNKRQVFNELMEGVEALTQEREGKLTLRKLKLDKKPTLQIEANEIVEIREQLHLSRAVFASFLRVPLRTLENWEQGKTKPNPTAAALLLLTQRYPDTIERLQGI